MNTCQWMDPEINYDVAEIFTEYGRKIPVRRGEIILNENDSNNNFYYVASGLLVAMVKAATTSDNIITKFIPENRAFGFLDYLYPGAEKYSLIAIRDGTIYALSYKAMNGILSQGFIEKHGFRRYCIICRENSLKAYSAMLALPPKKRIFTVCAAPTICRLKNKIMKNKCLKLTKKDIQCLVKAVKSEDEVEMLFSPEEEYSLTCH